jgi:uncharacterized oligopeptide transporter (OPT) family protein
MAMIVGGALGIALILAEEYTPRQHRKWLPSATGLGISGVIAPTTSISMFLGAFAAWLVAKASAKTDERYTVPVSSGLIAGESLMGVAVKLWIAAPGLWAEISKKLPF